MKILYVSLQSLRPGQAARDHVLHVARAWRRMGAEVEVCAPRTLAMEPFGVALFRRAAIMLRAVLQMRHYSVVYVRSHPLSLPLVLLARLARRAVFIEVNGTYEDAVSAYPHLRGLGPLLAFGETISLKLCSGAFAVTDPLCDYVRSRAPDCKVEYVPNAAGPVIRRGSWVHPERAAEPAYALFFGALASWQGVEVLLEAARSPSWPAEVRLTIAGDGARADLVRASATERPDIVEYVGRVTKSHLGDLIRGALCTLSVQGDVNGRSRYGLEPLKVYESLAHGTPVVVSDWPGQADLVRRGGCGIVVPPESPVAVAQAVLTIKSDPVHWNLQRERIAALIREGHMWSHRAGQTLRAMRECVAIA